MARFDFSAKNIGADIVSAAVSAIIAIPDAIATAILATVNPTQGFNSLMTGVPIGSLFTGSQFMAIGLTGAMALATADVLIDFSPEQKLPALFTLTILIGLYQLLFGLLKLGQYTKFISNTVMRGFLTGVAILVILGQLGDLTGYRSGYDNSVVRGLDTILHVTEYQWATLLVGLGTIAFIWLLTRTRLANLSFALGIVAASLAVGLLGLEGVAVVGDTNEIVGSLPRPTLPDLSIVRQLLLPSFAIALIGLVQSAGVSQTIPNPDGSYADASRDFTAQGVANIVAGFFRGMPLGGSIGATGIVMSTGARSRWANILIGPFVLIFVFFFAGLVEDVAMPAIAGALILIGLSIIDAEEIGDVWDLGWSKRLVMLATLIATLVLPVPQAILIGVFLSFVDFTFTSSEQVRLLSMRLVDETTFIEEEAPTTLPSREATILYSRGNTYFAAARTLQQLLPNPDESEGAVVIMRLRNQEEIGSTFILVLEQYAGRLAATGGKLMLSGVGPHVLQQLLATETYEAIPEADIFKATPYIGESTRTAVREAAAWLAELPQSGDNTPRPDDATAA